jgi:hypothetical protein
MLQASGNACWINSGLCPYSVPQHFMMSFAAQQSLEPLAPWKEGILQQLINKHKGQITSSDPFRWAQGKLKEDQWAVATFVARHVASESLAAENRLKLESAVSSLPTPRTSPADCARPRRVRFALDNSALDTLNSPDSLVSRTALLNEPSSNTRAVIFTTEQLVAAGSHVRSIDCGPRLEDCAAVIAQCEPALGALVELVNAGRVSFPSRGPRLRTTSAQPDKAA